MAMLLEATTCEPDGIGTAGGNLSTGSPELVHFSSRISGSRMLLPTSTKCSVTVFGKESEAIRCVEAAPSRAYTGSGIKRDRVVTTGCSTLPNARFGTSGHGGSADLLSHASDSSARFAVPGKAVSSLSGAWLCPVCDG